MWLSPSTLLLVSAFCTGFTGAGHTYGYFFPIITKQEAELFDSMRALRVDVFGSDRDHFTMYRGCSLLFSFAAASIIVISASLAAQVRDPSIKRGPLMMQIAAIAFANAGWSYISSYAFFVAPAAFTFVAAATAAAAAFTIATSQRGLKSQ